MMEKAKQYLNSFHENFHYCCLENFKQRNNLIIFLEQAAKLHVLKNSFINITLLQAHRVKEFARPSM
jgi:hypothetical protein